MADYNVKAIIDEAIDSKKDPSFPRGRVLSYIQRTEDSVLGHNRFKFSETNVEEALQPSALTYDFDCNHQEVISIFLVSEGSPSRLTYLPNAAFFDRYPTPESNDPGAPQHWTDFGGELYWDRPLDKQYTLKLQYNAAQDRLTDDANCVPTIPVEFSEILLRGAQAGIESYRENYAVEATHLRRVEEVSEDFLGRYGLRKRQPGKATSSRRRMVVS